jgi:spore maturation protein CgeB
VQVGIVGPVEPDYFADNIGDALKRIGHDVSQLGPARPHSRLRVKSKIATLARQAVPALDSRVQGSIVKAALEARCGVVISVDADLAPAAVTRLRREGVRVAFWFPDHVSNIGRQSMLLAPYNALFFKEPHLVGRYRATLGLPAYYLPQACNPRWHRPIGRPGSDPHLVIAGNMYPSRVRLVERLIEKGIPLKLYGSGFPRWLGESSARGAHTGRSVFREDKARVFRCSAGVLNTMHPAEVAGVNARLFEAAGCGAAILTEFRPTVPKLFSVGQEVLTYHDYDDLVDQAYRLLNEPGLGEKLGDAAALRAHRDHTYDLRVAEILEKLS